MNYHHDDSWWIKTERQMFEPPIATSVSSISLVAPLWGRFNLPPGWLFPHCSYGEMAVSQLSQPAKGCFYPEVKISDPVLTQIWPGLGSFFRYIYILFGCQFLQTIYIYSIRYRFDDFLDFQWLSGIGKHTCILYLFRFYVIYINIHNKE